MVRLPRMQARQQGIVVALVIILHGAAWTALQTRSPGVRTSPHTLYFELIPTPAVQPAQQLPSPPIPFAVPVRPRMHAPRERSIDDTAPDGKQEAQPPVVDEPSAIAPPEPDTPGLLERARSAAGKIDHALRNGTSGVPAEAPDTPMSRFRRGVENAFVGAGGGNIMDLYVSPDGVTITRIMSGNGVRCFISQLVNASPGAVIGGNVSGAREVNCPSGKDIVWKRL